MARREVIIDGESYIDFFMGADPEFRTEGFKPTPYLKKDGIFGTDGPNSQVCEIRPHPQYCPLNLVAETERAMRWGYIRFPQIQKFNWLGGSYPDAQPLAGHIHFDLNPNDPHMGLRIEALDKLLAPVSLMLENKDSAMHRRAHSDGNGNTYGKLGVTGEQGRGWHAQEYGGFEYRPLSSWLASKRIANATLCLAKVIAFQSHNKKFLNKIYWQLKTFSLDNHFKACYTACDKSYFKPMIPSIFRIIKTFKLYDRYKDHINYMFNAALIGAEWNEKQDFKELWNIAPKVITSKKQEKVFMLDMNDLFEHSIRDIQIEDDSLTFAGVE